MLAVRTHAFFACAMRVQALLMLVCRCLRTLLPALALALLVLGSTTSQAQTVVPPVPGKSPAPAILPPSGDPDPDPYDYARVVGISAPAAMTAGSTAYVTVTMRNAGTTTWYPDLSNPYRLGSQNPADNTIWGLGRVNLASTVAPGAQAVFGFTIKAPSIPGAYSFSWAMLREGLYWFGGTASSTITVSAPAPVYDAQLVSASVPSAMTAGSTYNVSMTFKNTGNVTWTSPDYLLGNSDDLTTFGVGRVAMSVASVAPGQSAVFAFQLRAPATAGTYTTQWGMLWEYHLRFGQTSRTNVTVNPATTMPKPTISVSRPALVAGQSFTTTWSTSNATSLTHVCTASGSGYTVNESLALNGSRTLTAQPAWVNYPSSCTWTASGAGGSAIYTETMTTVAGSNGSVTYIHTDGLGSPVARTDASGNVISRTRYEPYGYVASGVQPTIGFTGHVNDADTGLTYMQQRYYDPVAGRFLSIDPVVTDANTGGSFNRYAYANNSPYKYLDPDGRDAADKFNDQYKRDAESGNRKIWAPFEPVAIAVTVGMAVVPAAIAIGGEVAAAAAVKAVDKGVRITEKVLERKSAGRDGAQSRQIIEKRDGQMNSRTHEVTKDGEVIHQHQNHAGKYGGERQFPDEWTGTKTTNAPYENIPPSFGPDKIPSGGARY